MTRASDRSRWRGRLSLRGILTAALSLLAVAVLASAAATFYEHHVVGDLRSTVGTKLQPAQKLTYQLGKTFTDQRTAALAYLATGDRALQAQYSAADTDLVALQEQLSTSLKVDATAEQEFTRATAAIGVWQDAVGRRIKDLRPNHTLAGDAARRLGRHEAKKVDARLTTLSDRLDALVAGNLADIASAQKKADIAAIVAVALALLTAALAATLLRRLLTRPLEQLVTDVVAVADGVYDHPIRNRGPREVSLAARAVAHMRDEFMGHTRRLVDAQRQVTIQDERERMAADLHDLTLQDVYALGLTLDSVRMRHPELADELDVLIEDTRRMDRELRAIVFAVGNDTDPEELTTLVTRLAIDSRRVLGFAPSVHFQGAVDAAGDDDAARQLLMALRESLSNIARHAEATAASITVALTGGPDFVLRMLVVDNGVGPPDEAVAGNGLRNLVSRAERRGGRASMTACEEGGTQIDWWVPVNR